LQLKLPMQPLPALLSKWFNKWQIEGAKKAVVKVETEKDFYPLKEKAEELKIVSHIITDAGLTEIPAGNNR